MGVFKDSYDVIKDLLIEAKKLKNLDFIEMVLDIQERFFELRKENDEMKSLNKEQLNQINELKKDLLRLNQIEQENYDLKQKIASYDKSKDLSFLQQTISSKYTEYTLLYTSSTPLIKTTVEEQIGEIFYYVAPKLISPKEDDKFPEIFRKNVNGVYSYLESDLVGKLKAKFLEFKLIEIIDKANKSFVQLTEFGKQVLNNLNRL